MTSISHHYVPQVYLRQFVHPTSKADFWEYDLKNGTAAKSKPKKSGCEDYYNSVELRDGTRDDETVERSFFPLENALNRLFKTVRVSSNPPLESIPAEMWEVFYHFVAAQEARSPQRTETIHAFLSKIHQFRFDMIRNSTAFQAGLAEHSLDPKSIEGTEFEVEAGKGSAILMALEGIESTKKLLRQMAWTFFCAPPGKFFFTSERPVCLWVPPEKRNPMFGIGLADAEVEITFPLSRRICAAGRWQQSNKLYESLSPETVDNINDRSIQNARHFLYGPTKDDRIMEKVKQKATRLSQGG